MKIKIYHLLFWVFVVILLTLIFGSSWGNSLNAFYFVSLLLPVVIATSYFFNYFLVPRFLLRKKYFYFGLYLFYTFVVSLYLELLVLTFSFIYLANFNLGEINPYARDTLVLGIVLYMIVFLGSFLLMFQQLSGSKKKITGLINEKEKLQKNFFEVISNRKKIRLSYDEVLYIESLADYICIHALEGKEIISKEKISGIESRLPETFLRIHRSFIVNTEKVSGFNYYEIEIDGKFLNIGRSYKKTTMEKLKT